jgi:hypothetical protein
VVPGSRGEYRGFRAIPAIDITLETALMLPVVPRTMQRGSPRPRRSRSNQITTKFVIMPMPSTRAWCQQGLETWLGIVVSDLTRDWIGGYHAVGARQSRMLSIVAAVSRDD